MKRIGAAIVAIAVFNGASCHERALAAQLPVTSGKLQRALATDISVRGHQRRVDRDPYRPYSPYYYDRPTYYEPKPFFPLPPFFGYGWEPW
jgi:hypothetical protein